MAMVIVYNSTFSANDFNFFDMSRKQNSILCHTTVQTIKEYTSRGQRKKCLPLYYIITNSQVQLSENDKQTSYSTDFCISLIISLSLTIVNMCWLTNNCYCNMWQTTHVVIRENYMRQQNLHSVFRIYST